MILRLLLACLAAFGLVAAGDPALINTGTSANDRTGDPLRTAFQKINTNFSTAFDAINRPAKDALLPNTSGLSAVTSWSVLYLGDSLMANATEGRHWTFDRLFFSTYGLRGYGLGQFTWGAEGGASVSLTSYDDWINGKVGILTEGGMFTLSVYDQPVISDTLHLYYIKEPGAGSFSVAYDTRKDGLWISLAASVSCANATKIGAVASYTMPAGWHRVQLVGVSGICHIVDPVLYNSATPGVISHVLAFDTEPVASWTNCPVAVSDPILADMAPRLILSEWKEHAGDSWAEPLPVVEQNIRHGSDVGDWIYSTAFPTIGNDADNAVTIQLAAFLREYTRTNAAGAELYDGYQRFADTNKAATLGYYDPVGVHLSPAGVVESTTHWWNDMKLGTRFALNPSSPQYLRSWGWAAKNLMHINWGDYLTGNDLAMMSLCGDDNARKWFAWFDLTNTTLMKSGIFRESAVAATHPGALGIWSDGGGGYQGFFERDGKTILGPGVEGVTPLSTLDVRGNLITSLNMGVRGMSGGMGGCYMYLFPTNTSGHLWEWITYAGSDNATLLGSMAFYDATASLIRMTIDTAGTLRTFESINTDQNSGRTNSLGTSSFSKITLGTISITSGAGSPEAAVTAPVGSMYLNNAGGASTTLYIKETGTGNTGWVGK